jgi:hypothetical protein
MRYYIDFQPAKSNIRSIITFFMILVIACVFVYFRIDSLQKENVNLVSKLKSTQIQLADLQNQVDQLTKELMTSNDWGNAQAKKINSLLDNIKTISLENFFIKAALKRYKSADLAAQVEIDRLNKENRELIAEKGRDIEQANPATDLSVSNDKNIHKGLERFLGSLSKLAGLLSNDLTGASLSTVTGIGDNQLSNLQETVGYWAAFLSHNHQNNRSTASGLYLIIFGLFFIVVLIGLLRIKPKKNTRITIQLTHDQLQEFIDWRQQTK